MSLLDDARPSAPANADDPHWRRFCRSFTETMVGMQQQAGARTDAAKASSKTLQYVETADKAIGPLVDTILQTYGGVSKPPAAPPAPATAPKPSRWPLVALGLGGVAAIGIIAALLGGRRR